jgi:glycosyltransferase involved in cell wall biosynthesis
MAVRVVHLSSVHTPFDVRIFHRECYSLARADYDISVIGPIDHDQKVDRIAIKGVGARPRFRAVRMTRTIWRVFRAAVEADADVYHFHDPELIPVGLLLRAWGRHVIYDVHEDVPRTVLSRSYLPVWMRRPLAWLSERIENAASGRFSALVAATPTIAERFVVRNARTIVVHNFPRCEELVPPQGSWVARANDVAYVGLISENRGVREMVEAVNRLPAGLGARLKLAGRFESADLRETIVSGQGSRRVDVLGFIDRPALARLLERVRCGLVLLHPEWRFQVAYPVKLFEYMAAGVPVVASDFPLWRRIIDEVGCGRLVDPLDPDAIGSSIEYLLTHPVEAEAMGRRGREAVERVYNWASEERKLLALYEALSGSRCAA